MKIKCVMNKKIIKFSPEDSIVKVLKTFSKNNISGAPVVRGSRIVGIITDADIISKLDIYTPKIHFTSNPNFLLILAGLKGRRSTLEIESEMKVMRKFKVKDFMTKDVVTIDEDDDVFKAARLMHKDDIDRLPVVKKGKMVGIIARADIIRALSKME